MKRKLFAVLCLVLAAALLTSCSGKQETFEEYQPISQVITPTEAPAPVQEQVIPEEEGQETVGLMDQNPYDVDFEDLSAAALNEENVDPFAEAEEPAGYYFDYTSGETVYPYAGSTPIPLDPIDKPTPTPKPELTFTYTDYTSALGVSFKAPAGWVMDESQSQLCILSEPDAQVKDGQQAVVTISAEPLAAKYSEKDLKKHVTQRLSSLNTADLKSFSPSKTATRNMMGSTGVYANYSAVLADGTEIGGRIMYVSKDKTLYGLEIVYPRGYKGSFEKVFGEIRGSMKAK